MNKFLYPLFFLISILSISCSNEVMDITDNIEVEESSLVITEVNYNNLEKEALASFNPAEYPIILNTNRKIDFSKIFEIVEKNKDGNGLLNYNQIDASSNEILYFQELENLYNYGSSIIQSDLFESTSSIDERELYLKNILFIVISQNLSEVLQTTRQCSSGYYSCVGSAEDQLGISLAACTAGAVVVGIFSGGIGAAAGWPICAAAAGASFEVSRSRCGDVYCGQN